MPTEPARDEPTTAHAIEPLAPPEKPGALVGEIWLTVQTGLAQRLIHGRAATVEKPAIIGLVGFANRLRVVWLAARGDDPYADWWLIQVHEAIAQAEEEIHQQYATVTAQLHETAALEVAVAHSQKPYRVPLRFANPYAYRGAKLIADLDNLTCAVMTARHIGLLNTGAGERLVGPCARKVRALFAIPQRYRMMKLDRDTVRRGLGRASEARQVMGELPEAILRGERQAPIVPRRTPLPGSLQGHVALYAAPSTPNSSGQDVSVSDDEADAWPNRPLSDGS